MKKLGLVFGLMPMLFAVIVGCAAVAPSGGGGGGGSSSGSSSSSSSSSTSSSSSGTVAADSYEVDNTMAQAKSITIGTTQNHSLDTGSDVDWISFIVDQTIRSYTISCSSVNNNIDWKLYNSSGAMINGGTANTDFSYDFTSTGTYYLKILSSDGVWTGNYSIIVSQDSLPLSIIRAMLKK